MEQKESDIFDDLNQFERQVDRMMNGFFPEAYRNRIRVWHPPTDVYETDEAVIVKIEIAGMNPDDFVISFLDRVLTVSGVRHDVQDKLCYHRLEIPYGEFQTQVQLQGSFSEDQIEAHYENGYLQITLPSVSQEHHISVRVEKT